MSEQLSEAAEKGYATLAFGFRIKCPNLQEYRKTKNPDIAKLAQKEIRTLGNAKGGQSYGLLTSRAAIELQERILNSEYRYTINIVATIHDAIYCILPEQYEAVKWLNDNMIECMNWNKLPELQHESIKLSSKMDLYPIWSEPITFDNNASLETIKECIDGYYSNKDNPKK